MADNTPFRVNRSALPSSVQQLFNPENCFARGGLTTGAKGPVLTGNCQIVQFGRNSNGNNCMFVCQANFPDESYRPVLASFVFNHEGYVIDSYFGNSDAAPSWRTNIRDGTRASFGYLPPPPQPPPHPQPQRPDPFLVSRITAINDRLKEFHKSMSKDDIAALNQEKRELKVKLDKEAEESAQAAKAAHAAALDTYAARLKTPTWGCTQVLKGPLDFIGCQRDDSRYPSFSLVEGFPYVECVTTSAEFDAKLDTSPKNIGKITPYFKYDPVTGNTMYGASGHEYYDTEGFDNVCGNKGFQSFVVGNPNDERMRPMETRQGSCPYPKAVPPKLSAMNPNTQKEWERHLREGNESLRDQMKALNWLGKTQLKFPTAGPIDSAFADAAFGWVHELSIQFKPSRVSLSSAAMTKMLASSTHASVAAMHPSAMRAELFKRLTAQPLGSIGVRPIVNTCNCTPMNRNPGCLNHLCPFKHTRLARLQFEWPPFVLLDSGDPAARSALDSGIFEAARAKQQAAEAAEEKQRAAEAARNKKNELARQATAQRRLAAASAEPARRASRPSAAALASSLSAVAPAKGTKRAPESAASASAGPASASTTSRKKTKGGAKTKSKSKSKSKSKRRFHNHK